MTGRILLLLQTIALIIFILFFTFLGLIRGKSFLAPIAVASLLAMIVVPVGRWMEKHKLTRGLSSFLSTLLILLFFGALAFVLSAQVKNIVEDWPKMKKKIEPKIERIREFVVNKTGIEFKEISSPKGGAGRKGEGSFSFPGAAQGGQSKTSSLLSKAGTFVSNFFGFLGNFLLIHIYTFFFLLYRRKFRLSLLKLTSEGKREHISKVIEQSANVAQGYLAGKLILILILAVLYSVGLTVSNVQHAILISVLWAVLSLIPYIGNIIGFVLAVALGFVSGGGVTAILGITITFAIAQFVESYILEPYIVGNKVDLNPIISIIVVVLGGAVWGVLGMLLAMPVLGILKIVFDNTLVFRPLGYLFGEEDMKSGESKINVTKWVKDRFK